MLLTEQKLRRIVRRVLQEKKFSQLAQYAKNTEMDIYDDLMDPENEELRDEVFDLIDQSYAYLGGNADIKAPEHLMDPERNDYVYFKGWDIDADPEPDVVRGMKPKAGQTKLTLSAIDGTEAAAQFGIADTARRLTGGGHYAEMSGRAATVQMKQMVPVVTDEATVAALLPGKTFEWFGEHPFFAGDERFQDRGSEIEANKSKQYGPNGEYDGWYVRVLGGDPHAKMIFGAV